MMLLTRRCSLFISALLMHASVQAKEVTATAAETVSCFQNGQVVLTTRERIREFLPTSSLSLVADISLGQVRETRVRLYTSEQANVVCVVSTKE